MRSIEFSDKELIALYLFLKNSPCPDPRARPLLTARIEKMLFEFMTIAEIENIEEYYRSL